MVIYNDINQLPAFQNSVLTIGFFDGVHTGHQVVFEELIKQSKQIHGSSVVITFSPHPRTVVSDKLPPFHLLTTLKEKETLLNNLGIDYLVIVPFTTSFSELSAVDYITQFLVHHFKPSIILTGYDHRFGKDRIGDYALLEKYAPIFGYKVIEIPAKIVQDISISSTRIRNLLADGNIEQAKQLLGYRYFFSGVVSEGNKIGRTIGFPTANLTMMDSEKLVPGNGVYAVQVSIADDPILYKGMMNIGIRPSFSSKDRSIEVHIFDFDKDIYGLKVTVYLYSKLRPEIKFNHLEELKHQLHQDQMNALERLMSF